MKPTLPRLKSRTVLVTAILVSQAIILTIGWLGTFRIVRHHMAQRIAARVIEDNVNFAERYAGLIDRLEIMEAAFGSENWSQLQTLVEDAELEAAGFMCILDADDRILCHPDLDQDPSLRGVDLSDVAFRDLGGEAVDLRDTPRERIIGGEMSFLADGVHYIATAPLPSLGGRLLVHQPEYGLLSRAETMTRPVLIASGVVGLLTLGVTGFACFWLLGRYDSVLETANQYFDREVERIGRIQRALLPSEAPAAHGLDVAVSYETFDRAGGDMYAFLAPPDGDPRGRWGVLIADVSGHGPAAAVVMAMLRGGLWNIPGGHDDPGRVLTELNGQLCATPIERSFVTATMLVFDATARTIEYATAGHPPALVRRSGTLLELDAVGGVPLGVLADERYENATHRCADDELIVLITDGVLEVRPIGGELFGANRLQAVIRDAGDDARAAVDAILRAVRDHLDGARPEDDQTLVALRVRSSIPESGPAS